MRRTVVIAPCLLSEPDGDSVLRQRLPALSMLAERGALTKIAAVPPTETPEALLLGLSPSDVRLAQGPLTVSALGFDPPERSTHFHLSLLSFVDGAVVDSGVLPLPEEVDALLLAAKRLDTKLFTVLKGEQFDHGLVWEALGDLSTQRPAEVVGRLLKEVLPEGDGEVGLRRLIDDSINLFSEMELNERRADEGLPPFNLLWPWGHGVRTAVPNLALRRGEPAFVESDSMRLAGLVRLAGYRHGDRHLFGSGLQTRFRSIANRALSRELAIVFIDTPSYFRQSNQPEELEWFVREMDRELLQPLLDGQLDIPSVLTLIACGPLAGSSSVIGNLKPSPVGLAATSVSGRPFSNSYPFDERALEERAIPTVDLWSAVAAGLEAGT